MKRLVLLFVFLIPLFLFAATRFWVGGGASANWSATGPTNWSATSGGSNNATVPGSTDDVTFNGTGASANSASTVSANITVLSLTFTSGYTQTVTINTGVTLTIAGNFTDNTAHGWTVSGTGAMAISAASTITSGGKTFPGPVTFSTASTKTLSGDWTITGLLTCVTAVTTTINKTASEVLSCGGWNVIGTVAGTANITITGGTWSGTGTNTLSGTITFAGSSTFSGIVHINGCTLTYGSGTITTTSSTLQIDGSCTLNTAGVIWNSVTVQNTATITNNSLLTATGTLTLQNGANPTFTGTTGWTVATFTDLHISSGSMTLKNGNTYTVTTAFNEAQSRTGSIVTITSDDPTLKAILTINYGTPCNVIANFTRIDASAGRTIWSFNGTITSCLNINSFTELKNVSKTYIQ